ncbi:K2CO protein, partial [Neopipo cinnamomea]|nr:K2CO protein [Neopipo cinnamomea]
MSRSVSFSSRSASGPAVTQVRVSSVSSTRGIGGGSSGLGRAGGFGSSSLFNLGSTKRVSLAGSGSLGVRSGFGPGSAGLGPLSPAGIQEVTVNQSLLTPLSLEIDPNIQRVRKEEKEQIKTLNNKFASFIDKVGGWGRKTGEREGQGNIWSFLGNTWKSLGEHLEIFRGTSGDLQGNIWGSSGGHPTQGSGSEFTEIPRGVFGRYEDEINKRAAAENEFVVLKKDVDAAYMNKVELEAKVDALTDEINFLRAFHEA